MDLQPHIEKFAARMAEVEAELGDPKVFENNRRAQELGREYARLKELVARGEEYLKARDELAENRELAAGDDPEMAEMAAEEIARLEARVPELEQELQLGLVPSARSGPTGTAFNHRVARTMAQDSSTHSL